MSFKITLVEGHGSLVVEQTPEQVEARRRAIEAHLDAAKGGYTSEQLEEAFELVKPKPHWKGFISAIVDADKVNVLSFAIPWYCGGMPEFTPMKEKGKVWVQHPGYWACIGS